MELNLIYINEKTEYRIALEDTHIEVHDFIKQVIEMLKLPKAIDENPIVYNLGVMKGNDVKHLAKRKNGKYIVFSECNIVTEDTLVLEGLCLAD